MHSKNKSPMTNAERAHVERVKALPCVVCNAPAPSEAHEIVQGLWWLCAAVCADCHRGSFNGIHGQQRMWKVKRMTENDAVNETLRRLAA